MSRLFALLAAPFQRGGYFQSHPAPEPEPVRPQSRPMTGFLATLSAEQRAAALSYCGEDRHG
jgi:hypothetical protein